MKRLRHAVSYDINLTSIVRYRNIMKVHAFCLCIFLARTLRMKLHKIVCVVCLIKIAYCCLCSLVCILL